MPSVAIYRASEPSVCALHTDLYDTLVQPDHFETDARVQTPSPADEALDYCVSATLLGSLDPIISKLVPGPIRKPLLYPAGLRGYGRAALVHP